MQQRIETALAALVPDHLSVLDESHMHSRGLQTHFKAVLVSQQFEGLNRMRWRCIPTRPKNGRKSTQPRPRRPAPEGTDSSCKLQVSSCKIEARLPLRFC